MKNAQIEKHEKLKQLSEYVYDVDKRKLPEGYDLIGISSNDKTGFYAGVVRHGNEITIVYKGTDATSTKDIKNDILMGTGHLPEQVKDAVDLYDRIKYEYPNCEITVTGHSLGGSLAQIVGAKRGAETVTFNAYGTKDIIKNDGLHHYEDNITNYCNPNDPITMRNAKNQIGNCYEVETKPDGGQPHKLENFDKLETRKEVNPEDMHFKYFKTEKEKQELEEYKKTGKNTISMPGMHSNNDSKCSGSYSVSGYTRADGKKVDGYTRSCYVHSGSKSVNGKPRYHDIPLDKKTPEQLDAWLEDVV